MDDPFFDDSFLDDPFLDDYDLFLEGLLSEEDARQMFIRGEISEQQLNNYLQMKADERHQAQESEANPFIVILVLVIITLMCFFSVIGGMY